MLHRVGQYEAACNGLDVKLVGAGDCPADCSTLGTPGYACPAVLKCSRASATMKTTHSSCTVRRLVGIGFNPSIVRAPLWIHKLHGWSDVRYVAAERYERNNKRVRCGSSVVHEPVQHPHLMSSTQMLLLDKDFGVVARMQLFGGECARGVPQPASNT